MARRDYEQFVADIPGAAKLIKAARPPSTLSSLAGGLGSLFGGRSSAGRWAGLAASFTELGGRHRHGQEIRADRHRLRPHHGGEKPRQADARGAEDLTTAGASVNASRLARPLASLAVCSWPPRSRAAAARAAASCSRQLPRRARAAGRRAAVRSRRGAGGKRRRAVSRERRGARARQRGRGRRRTTHGEDAGLREHAHARVRGGRLEGEVALLRAAASGSTCRSRPSSARPGASSRRRSPTTSTWAAAGPSRSRSDGGATSSGVAEFVQYVRGRVTGTILTPTGDHRFLAGEAHGDELFLSRFRRCVRLPVPRPAG